MLCFLLWCIFHVSFCYYRQFNIPYRSSSRAQKNSRINEKERGFAEGVAEPIRCNISEGRRYSRELFLCRCRKKTGLYSPYPSSPVCVILTETCQRNHKCHFTLLQKWSRKITYHCKKHTVYTGACTLHRRVKNNSSHWHDKYELRKKTKNIFRDVLTQILIQFG